MNHTDTGGERPLMSEIWFVVKELDYGETPYDLCNLVGVKLTREAVHSKDQIITQAVEAVLSDGPRTPWVLKGRMKRFIMPNGDEQVYLDDKLVLTFNPPSFSMDLSEDGTSHKCVCNQPYIKHWKEATE